MTPQERINQVVARFNVHSDWEDRYKELIQIGKNLTSYPEEQRVEKFKVKGCQSQVWLFPEFKDSKLFLHADSDALLVKGIVGLLTQVYSGLSPQEILATPADFLKEIGITEHLSMNRSNGLASMLKQIQMYALVYKSLGEKS